MLQPAVVVRQKAFETLNLILNCYSSHNQPSLDIHLFHSCNTVCSDVVKSLWSYVSEDFVRFSTTKVDSSHTKLPVYQTSISIHSICPSVSSTQSSHLTLTPPHSSDSGTCGERWAEQQDSEGDRFRFGTRMASDHKDECGWDVRLDGPWGHPLFDLLQGQWCLEVGTRKCVWVFLTYSYTKGKSVYVAVM